MIGNWVQSWNRFWFESFDPIRWKLFRIAVCLIGFGFYAIRHVDLLEFYTNRNGFPLEALDDFFKMQWRWSLLREVQSDGIVLALHLLFLALLLVIAAGWGRRWITIPTFILHLLFARLNLAAMYGVDTVMTFFLFSMCFAGTGKPRHPLDWLFSSVGMRLAQVQVCLIYGFSGLGKLKGVSWWSGEALWGVLANPQLARFDFSWTAHFPVLIALATSATVYWEIYFPLLIWIPQFRPWWLIIGTMLHLAIAVMMNLPFFAAIMMSSYFLFLSEREKTIATRCLNVLGDGLSARIRKIKKLSQV
jgi:hypothetical protein